MPNFIKHIFIAEKIVFIDSLWGAGKSVVAPVLGSLKNVEKQIVEGIFERICLLEEFKKIDSDAAITLIRLYADELIYDSVISRRINFRIFDDSGFLNNPKKIKYIAQLFFKDGEAAMERIRKNKPILQIMTHQLMPVVNFAFRALGERLRVIEMVRHPLYMINHWFNYIERCGTDPREFNLWIEYKGKALPWFAAGWEEKFISLKTMDKVIHSLDLLINKKNESFDKLDERYKRHILFIPFENFVTNPWPFVREIELFLDTQITAETRRVLKRQRCPRKCLSAGRGHKHYGWNKVDRNLTDIMDLKKRKNFVESKANRESIAILNKISEEYENRYNVFKDSSLESIRNHRNAKV